MKSLYEATLGGWIGCSYVRCYIWAESKEQALKLATEKFGGTKYANNINITLLFREDSEPFCTNESDEGWEVDK